ncbi:putative pheromone receptor 2 protein [Eutypa lata UCREL1]|uniref:Putative pheromone receptor 2 protein n=1 Tax=Eutypa lata (strain UCR-EL1) TaxID=1287681 RepID=M7T4F8_EUTLA|nr:putative pheromone receptor 2 protein [Eutypa lata UCREL1]
MDFDPRNQTFSISGRDGNASIPILMSTIEAQRVRLANIAINYGCQLGLTLMSLIVVLLLLPPSRMRRPLHLVQISALVVAVGRLCLLVLYFPGPLTGYYVAWTHDAGILNPSDYAASTTANALGVVQFALVEAALVMQAWAMIRTWPRAWQLPLLVFSGLLATATVAIKGVWAVQHTRILLRGRTLPVPLTKAGEAAVALGAVSIFWFCGIFFAHLTLHLICLFAGLDIAAGIGDTRVLPFDAGSWVQTLTAAGLPLIGLVAQHRGSNSRKQQQHGNTTPSSREVDKVEKKIKDKEDTEAVDETMAGSESSLKA